MRINQYLARSGVASRRKSEELILSGAVLVNGEVVQNLATDIHPNEDVVTINGAVIALPQKKYYMLNKPAGHTTTRTDPHAKKTVFELLPDDPSLITVGRLDKETTGLLLVTNDGDFAQNIIHPSKKIEKVYLVKTKDIIQNTKLENLTEGLELDDGPAKFTYIKEAGLNSYEVGIEEGRNRIVRRMFETVGNKVVGLERIRIGKLSLDVAPGKYRDLTEEEINYYA
jgi:23S rRNA pseudouridine2605 synthase